LRYLRRWCRISRSPDVGSLAHHLLRLSGQYLRSRCVLPDRSEQVLGFVRVPTGAGEGIEQGPRPWDEPDAAFALDIVEFTAHGLQEQDSPPGAGSLQSELLSHAAGIAHIDQRSTCLSIRPVLPCGNDPGHGIVHARFVQPVDEVTPSFRDLDRDPGTATPGNLPSVA